METLVVVAQHRNQYCSRVKSQGPARFGSSPSRNFREINCRTFQSGVGILPTPFTASTTPVTKRLPSSLSSSSSPKTPSPAFKSQSNSLSVNTCAKTASRSSPIPINFKVSQKETSFNEEELGILNESLSFSERWAGPAYSNSPPPSSLPIPKFSMRPKRTVSLDLPGSSDAGIKVHPIAKSAPASPTREYGPSAIELFLSADSATKTLRRILNLDVGDN